MVLDPAWLMLLLSLNELRRNATSAFYILSELPALFLAPMKNILPKNKQGDIFVYILFGGDPNDKAWKKCIKLPGEASLK